jgi:uncharacterized membrane protein YhdT
MSHRVRIALALVATAFTGVLIGCFIACLAAGPHNVPIWGRLTAIALGLVAIILVHAVDGNGGPPPLSPA